jgi:hypothetical protein
MVMTKVEFLADPVAESKVMQKVLDWTGGRVLAEPYKRRIDGLFGSRLTDEISRIHEEQNEEINRKLQATRTEWGRIEGKYAGLFEKLTGYGPDLRKTCYIAPTILGFAEVSPGKRIFISSTLPQDSLNYLVPHEMTHLFYRDVMAKLNNPEAMTPALMESVDHLILFKSPIYRLLNTSLKYENLGFIKKNPEFMKDLDKLWQERKEFSDFLAKAVSLAGKRKDIVIC